jgi:deoxyguanosine kinase
LVRPFRQNEPVPYSAPWAVSDFWFDQSPAFARAWLPPEQLSAFIDRWKEVRRSVTKPKLIVLLDAPAETLLARLHKRGRPCEQHLTEQQLERIRQAISEQTLQADVGPVLRLNNADRDAALAEVLAAVRAAE